ncbi:MAG TPA: hypothetical protein VK440_03560 [Burkholderiales bacterium]|nr:hypothetical protein [Burkholderiales bacterium]
MLLDHGNDIHAVEQIAYKTSRDHNGGIEGGAVSMWAKLCGAR